ncbi:MAG: hypothetical protein JXX28_12830 [Deltaproteobacteria bacterium]|nr:hypothetical protein [Deltaproteobacteria bacterium]
MSEMFCFQCADTARGEACTVRGVCGREPEVAALHDLLLFATVGLSQVAHRVRLSKLRDPSADALVLRALSAGRTNALSDGPRVEDLTREAVDLRERLLRAHREVAGPAVWTPTVAATFAPAMDYHELIHQADVVGLGARRSMEQPEVVAAQELVIYGLRGLAAHAVQCEEVEERVLAFVHEALDALTHLRSTEALAGLARRVGERHKVVLHRHAHELARRFGEPVQTLVRTTPVRGKAILVSGHDIAALERVLRLADGQRVKVYTHGDLRDAHAYPALRGHVALAGHLEGAWFDQRKVFEAFPGPVLVTSDRLLRPSAQLSQRLFTTGSAGWTGVPHLDSSLAPLLAKAHALPGYPEDQEEAFGQTGLGRAAAEDKIREVAAALRSGRLQRVLVISGEDQRGRKGAYYEDLSARIPAGTAVIAAGSVATRLSALAERPDEASFLDLGTLTGTAGVAGLVDLLATELRVPVSGLPLTLMLSWYGQRSVAQLLASVASQMPPRYIGPVRPAFLTPALQDTLLPGWDLRPVQQAQADALAMFGPA